MVKIWGIPHNRRAKKFKGHIRVQAMKGGGYQAASWPRKGQYDKSPAGYERSRLFGLIQHWSTRPLWWEQLDALNLSVGTPYLPRDILTKSAYGTLTWIRMKDGTELFPQKIMSQQIQAELDTISTAPGTMLIRTASEWIGLAPGPADTVLTAHGPAVAPSWTAPAGGGGGAFWTSPHSGGNAPSAGNFARGFALRPFVTVAVTGVAVWVNSTQPDAFMVSLVEYEDDEIIAVPHQQVIANDSPSPSAIRPLIWGDPWVAEEGRLYALLINAMSGDSTASWQPNGCTDYIPGVPTRPNQAIASCSGKPEVGKQISFPNGLPIWIATEWQAGT